MSYTTTVETPLLDAAEEVALAKQIEAGTAARDRIEAGQAHDDDEAIVAGAERARRRFIESNVRLVLSIASKTKAPAHVEREDMIQDGMIGLDRAVTKFDWRRGYKFSTYATWWIRQAIQRGIENTGGTVRIPAHQMSELRTVLREDRVTPLRGALGAALTMSNIDSLDRPIGDAGSTVADISPAADTDPEVDVERRFERAAVVGLLTDLDPTTRWAVVARFGLDGSEPATFGAIGAALGVTQEAARRRVHRALANLRPAAETLVTAA